MKHFLIASLLLYSIATFAHARDSFVVYFPLNKSELTELEKQKIDSLIYNDILHTYKNITIIGYTDYLADSAYNMKLSRARAENVKAYLINSGFKTDDIVLCVGRGKIQSAVKNDKQGISADRKVIIAYTKKPKPDKPKDIKSLKVNETMALKNINFWAGSANILESSKPELEKLYETLKANPTMKVRIEGHICCDPQNMEFMLSVTRAKTVYSYLINKGIDSARLDYKGCGTANPVRNPEVTEEDRIQNRRVEVRILAK